MSRTRDPGGKHVTLALRVTDEKAAEIDAARGTVTRAAWLAGLVDAALERGGGRPRGRAGCWHPQARRQKGLCMACGTAVPG